MNAIAALQRAIECGEPAILVTVSRASGSTPREAGASMLVTPTSTHGTIGGGALEMEAIIEARRMIAEGTANASLDIALGPAIGQCCGGRVELALEQASAASLARVQSQRASERQGWPAVIVFGAGHTGQALARALAPLPLRLRVVDTRAERLAELPEGIEHGATPLPERDVDRAEPGTAFVVMTHDHGLDFLLAARALARGDSAYVGMIGSATKRAKFLHFLRDTGSRADPARLVLPIGGTSLRDKRPEVIAALVAAELLVALNPLKNSCTDFARASLPCSMDPVSPPAHADRRSP